MTKPSLWDGLWSEPGTQTHSTPSLDPIERIIVVLIGTALGRFLYDFYPFVPPVHPSACLAHAAVGTKSRRTARGVREHTKNIRLDQIVDLQSLVDS